ncbi:MAG TPA: hypothetical protein VF732_02545 [Nitrospira sp.]
MKKTASLVLASLNGSTHQKRTPRHPGHWALTNSRPSENVTLIILRVEELAAAECGKKRFGASGLVGETVSLFEQTRSKSIK